MISISMAVYLKQYNTFACMSGFLATLLHKMLRESCGKSARSSGLIDGFPLKLLHIAWLKYIYTYNVPRTKMYLY